MFAQIYKAHTIVVGQGAESKQTDGTFLSTSTITVILEILLFLIIRGLKETAKIKNSKILFEQIFNTANIYGLLNPQITDYSEN